MHSCNDCNTKACSTLAAEDKDDGVVGFLSFCPNWLPLSLPTPAKPKKSLRLLIIYPYNLVKLSTKAANGSSFTTVNGFVKFRERFAKFGVIMKQLVVLCDNVNRRIWLHLGFELANNSKANAKGH